MRQVPIDRWPEGTIFCLHDSNQQADRVQLGLDFSSESPVGQALAKWLVDPQETLTVAAPKGMVVYRLLEFRLPGGQWVPNEPGIRDALRTFSAAEVMKDPERALTLTRALSQCDIPPGLSCKMSLEQAEALLKLERLLASLPAQDQQHFRDALARGEVGAQALPQLIAWTRAFRRSPEMARKRYPGKVPPGMPVSIVLDYERYWLDRGEYHRAARIVSLLRNELRDPQSAVQVAREFKTRVPLHSRVALLTAGIAALVDCWDIDEQAPTALLYQAEAWGKEALAIEASPYTCCALARCYAALEQEQRVQEMVAWAERLGKGCELAARRVRRVNGG